MGSPRQKRAVAMETEPKRGSQIWVWCAEEGESMVSRCERRRKEEEEEDEDEDEEVEVLLEV